MIKNFIFYLFVTLLYSSLIITAVSIWQFYKDPAFGLLYIGLFTVTFVLFAEYHPLLFKLRRRLNRVFFLTYRVVNDDREYGACCQCNNEPRDFKQLHEMLLFAIQSANPSIKIQDVRIDNYIEL